MRLFIAVWLSRPMLSEVKEYMTSAGGSGFRWTAPENLHFTLKFLGETAPPRLAALRGALQKVSLEQTEFSLKLGEPGYFPNRQTPRIIWLGVAVGQSNLAALAASIETACSSAGFSDSTQPFKPHLTIARVKENVGLVALPDRAVTFAGETLVTGFSLVESQLTRRGPVYRILDDFKFQ